MDFLIYIFAIVVVGSAVTWIAWRHCNKPITQEELDDMIRQTRKANAADERHAYQDTKMKLAAIERERDALKIDVDDLAERVWKRLNDVRPMPMPMESVRAVLKDELPHVG
ncbi:hypothetical protein LCGC14_0319700 [marine sediment metagenome]|uniref:Uncharacterized protein n=1 Tax=marine sediment metagenome TaxID=412755 RepID=A0A0F9U241_9ZZZZ